jgi:hypothetical protein
MGGINLFRGLGPGGSIVVMLFYGSTFLYIVTAVVMSVFSLLVAGFSELPATRSLGQLMLMLLPMYVIGLAPALAAFLRNKIAHEREFLADADAALLTNDPEGLALALAKVTAAVGVSKERDPATAHMFFVDPAPPAKLSWLLGVFPTHPNPEERIELLTRMGDGIVEGLEAASDAGVNYRGELLLRQYAPRKSPSTSSAVTADQRSTTVAPAARHNTAGITAQSGTGSQFPLMRNETPLYERPDGWSAIVQMLSAGLVVTVVGCEGNFVHVLTDSGEGYIPRGAIAARAATL